MADVCDIIKAVLPPDNEMWSRGLFLISGNNHGPECTIVVFVELWSNLSIQNGIHVAEQENKFWELAE
jgi:hypothetical protein